MTSVEQLVQRWQQARAANDTALTASLGRTLTEYTAPIVSTRVAAAVQKYGGASWNSDEFTSAAWVAAASAMTTYSPDKGAAFATYCTKAVDLELAKLSQEGSGHGTMPRHWRVAMQQLPHLTDTFMTTHHRQPSTQELKSAFQRHALQWCEARVEPTPGQSVQEAVADKMASTGMLYALEDFEQIVALSQRPVSSSEYAEILEIPDTSNQEETGPEAAYDEELLSLSPIRHAVFLGTLKPVEVLENLKTPTPERWLRKKLLST